MPQDDEQSLQFIVNQIVNGKGDAYDKAKRIESLFTDKLKNLPEMQMEPIAESPTRPIPDYEALHRNKLRTAILKSWEE